MTHSIVVPAHNEAENLEPYVSTFVDRLLARMPEVDWEVLLVENGSRDDTLACARRLEARYPDTVRVLSNARGSYGEAIKRGMLEARGARVTVLECDFLDLDFVRRSIDALERGARFVVGSKRHPESVDRRPLKRRLLTRAFNALLKLAFGYPGTDTHGLKTIDAALAKELCRKALTTDEVFQTEIVLLAWKLGEEIVELPVRIEEVRCAPVSIPRRFPMVIDLVAQLRRSLERFPPGKAG